LQQEVIKLGVGEILPIRCDVRIEAEILEVFEQIKSKYGGVDICVNNAGVAYNASLLEGSTDEWRAMLDVSPCLFYSKFVILKI